MDEAEKVCQIIIFIIAQDVLPIDINIGGMLMVDSTHFGK
jgi:hypothetical protein